MRILSIIVTIFAILAVAAIGIAVYAVTKDNGNDGGSAKAIQNGGKSSGGNITGVLGLQASGNYN